MPKANKPTPYKSHRQVRKALERFRLQYSDWKEYEPKMNELASQVNLRGEAIDVFLERLYRMAKAMDKPLVELIHA